MSGDVVERLRSYVQQFEDDLNEDLATEHTGERVDLLTREIDVPVDDLIEAADLITSQAAEIERLKKERDEAYADAYRSSLLAIDRLAEADKEKERANANWRSFRDLRLAIIGDGPMCRDCADADGRCPSSGKPCDPDEAVTEQLSAWRSTTLTTLTNGGENGR